MNEQELKEEAVLMAKTTINLLKELKQRCTKKDNKKFLDRTIKRMLWVLIDIESGEGI